MGGLRRRLAYLDRQSRGETVSIPQQDGSVARFPQSALKEAFLISMRRLCGERLEPHPLNVAVDNSDDPNWRGTVYGSMRIIDQNGVSHDPVGYDLPDLSEQA